MGFSVTAHSSVLIGIELHQLPRGRGAAVHQTKGRRGAIIEAAQEILRLCWQFECVQGQGVPVFASRQSDEQNSFPGSAGHVQRGFAHDFVAMILLLLP